MGYYCEMSKIKILGAPITEGLNDAYTYPEGGSPSKAIFNFLTTFCKKYPEIGYEVLLTRNKKYRTSIPKNLTVTKTHNSTFMYYNIFKNLTKVDILTQLYFIYGSSYNLMSKYYPYVIGFAEPSHIRFSDEITGLQKIKKIAKPLALSLFKNTLDHCDKLIVTGKVSKNLYNKFVPNKKIDVIPYGVDLNRFNYTYLPHKRNILLVGNLIKRKGFKYVIEALPTILKEYPDTEVNIIGNGPQEHSLKLLSKKLNVKNSIKFHNCVSYLDLISAYKHNYLLCQPSLGEGYSHTITEAMATGRPVVCTKNNGSEMIEKNEGIIVPMQDSAAIGEAILTLFSDSKLAQQLGVAGQKKIVREHNWDIITEKYRNIFREVMQ